MPKVSVYLPDELYQQVRDHGLRLSALTQHAVEEELRRRSLASWIEQERHCPPRMPGPVDTEELLDEVRSEFGP